MPTPEGIRGQAVPTLAELGISTDQDFECGGEDAAGQLLAGFVRHGLAGYPVARDVPCQPGTSMLSRHLHLGTISARLAACRTPMSS